MAGLASAPSAAVPAIVPAVRAAMVAQMGMTVPAGAVVVAAIRAVPESGTVARAVWGSRKGAAVRAG